MIVLQCNDTYYRWLILFLESYVALGHRFPIFISIFNGTIAMKAEIQSICEFAKVELDSTNQYGLPLQDIGLRECMTSRKVYVLSDVVDRFEPDWVLMLDVDTLCRTDFSSWIQELLDDSVQMALCKNVKVTVDDFQRYYSASTNFFSKSAFHVIHQWLEFIQRKTHFLDFKPFDFGWDQLCLYLVVQNYESELNISFLDRLLFIDDSFGRHSFFWTWGTPIQLDKDYIFEFFNAHKLGQSVSHDSAKRYMQLFFEHRQYRPAFVFANLVIQIKNTDPEALFVLGVVYYEELHQLELAKQIFNALLSIGYRSAECNRFIRLMD